MEIQEQFGWAVSVGCSHVSWGCSDLMGWGGSLSKVTLSQAGKLMQAGGRGPHFLSTWAYPPRCWNVLTWWLASRERAIHESKLKTAVPFMTQPWKSSHWSHTAQLYSLWEGMIEGNESRGQLSFGDHPGGWLPHYLCIMCCENKVNKRNPGLPYIAGTV